MSFYLSCPKLLNVFEALLCSEIIHHDDSVSPFIVGTCDCSKSFLASSIPDLKFDFASVEGKRSTLDSDYLNRKSTPMVAR